MPEAALWTAVRALAAAVTAPKSVHAATAALALGHAGLRGPLPFPPAEDGAEGAAAAAPDAGPAGTPTPDVEAAPSMQGVLAAVVALLSDKDVKACL